MLRPINRITELVINNFCSISFLLRIMRAYCILYSREESHEVGRSKIQRNFAVIAKKKEGNISGMLLSEEFLEQLRSQKCILAN